MRNQSEQIAYLIKHRRDGMSNADFEKELETLFELGYNEGYNEGYYSAMNDVI